VNEPFKIDFVGIGASKSGTTWLGHVLAEHPEVCMSEPKELHFFNDKLFSLNRFQERRFHLGLDWYQKHFAHCASGKIKGEITPRYCSDPVAAERIFQHNPNIRILYCLREPVDRIESHYNFAKYYVGKEDRTLDHAIRTEPEYIDMTRYGHNLDMYLSHFPMKQICIIWFDDIHKRPEQVIRQVYEFLGVDPAFIPPSLHTKSNPARASKSIGVELFLQKVNSKLISWGLSGLVHKIKRSPLKDRVMKLNSRPLQKERMTPATRQFVLDILRPDMEHLQSMTGRDLSHWMHTDQ
jgi:hypothetical protein